jgi:type IV fimbrial biogenesis protein FimT
MKTREGFFMKIFKKSGFTLIEMIIVIAIMGIVSAISAPNLFNYMAERRLNGAARMVMSDLLAARQSAVTENNNFKIFFNANQHTYTVLDDNNNDGSITSGEATQVKDIQRDYYDVTCSSTTDPVFAPRGTSTNGATVTLTSTRTGGSKYVKVAWTGRVKIDDTP